MILDKKIITKKNNYTDFKVGNENLYELNLLTEHVFF